MSQLKISLSILLAIKWRGTYIHRNLCRMESLDKDINILWEQKSNAPINFWGLDVGGPKLNRKVDGGLFGGFSMFSGNVGPLGQLLILTLISYISISTFWKVAPMLTFLFICLLASYAIYRFFIREFKYYQLAKNTIYQITKDEILIKYSFLGFKKTVQIPIDEISHLHEIEYDYDGIVKGSIWIYHDSDVKAYDLVKRERTVLPMIQMVQNHKTGLSLLRSLIKESKSVK